MRRPLSSTRWPNVAVLLLASIAACKEKRPPQRPTPVVAVTKALKVALPYVVSRPGEVEASRTVAVMSQVGGMLTRVAFVEGDEVRKGQVLFEIDPRQFQADLSRVSGTLARDEAQLAQAKSIVTRYSTLAKDGYATREQMDQVTANAAALEATVASDRAAVDAAKLALDQATVRAPITGRTGLLSIKEGSLVRAMSTPELVTINEVHPILVKFSIPERDFAEMRRRSGVNKELNVAVRPGTAGDTTRPIAAKLMFVNNAIDRTTGTVTLKASAPNLDGALWPGQFVNVGLELGVDSNAVTVPTQAIVTSQTGTVVFTVDDSRKAKRVPVRVGRTAGLQVVIDEGLSGGETVITDGQKLLNEGVTVEIRSATGAPTEGRGRSVEGRGEGNGGGKNGGGRNGGRGRGEGGRGGGGDSARGGTQK